MNWKLIFQLSLFGFAMAISTVYWIPSRTEPLFWLAIFIICAYMIARNCADKFFLHGLFVSLLNSIWITVTHILLFNSYVANHPQEAQMMTKNAPPYPPQDYDVAVGSGYRVYFRIGTWPACICRFKDLEEPGYSSLRIGSYTILPVFLATNSRDEKFIDDGSPA